MGEALTLEEQKDNEKKRYGQSVILFLFLAVLASVTTTLVVMFNLMALAIWYEGSTSGLHIALTVVPVLPMAATGLLTYFSIWRFAKGWVFYSVILVTLINVGCSVASKIVFMGTIPTVLWVFSWVHEITCFLLILGALWHKASFFNSLEFGYDEFECLDKIVKPGMEEAMQKLFMKDPPILEDSDEEVDIVGGGGGMNLDKEMLSRRMPTLPVTDFPRPKFEYDFQKSVKVHAKEKRDLLEWMQSVKYEDMKRQPMNNPWMRDRVGKALGRHILGQTRNDQFLNAAGGKGVGVGILGAESANTHKIGETYKAGVNYEQGVHQQGYSTSSSGWTSSSKDTRQGEDINQYKL